MPIPALVGLSVLSDSIVVGADFCHWLDFLAEPL